MAMVLPVPQSLFVASGIDYLIYLATRCRQTQPPFSGVLHAGR
jgi:hypothetical protein